MKNVINILDYPCGSGKTTQMIEGFEVGRKYLVILPYLTEIDRLLAQPKAVDFVAPVEDDNPEGTKYSSLEAQLKQGLNIATTHYMYERLVPLVHQGLLDDYDIIIDEVPAVVKQVAHKSKTSIQEFYVDPGYMDVDDVTGLIKPTQKWWENSNDVSDTLSSSIITPANTGCLYLQGGKTILWALPRTILTAGRSVTIMTYKAEGSLLLPYLRKLGLPYEVSNDNCAEEKFRRKAAELITVEGIGRLSEIPLGFNKQGKAMSDPSTSSKISYGLKNLRERKLKGVSTKDILLTCRKDAWFKASNDNKPNDQDDEAPIRNDNPGVFAKNSRLKDAYWTGNTTRGTNKFIHCSHLIYLYDKNVNPSIASWLGSSAQAYKDAYALTELIQWIWRSRIRRGEPITVFIPSPRMLGLFERWLYGEVEDF